MQHTRPKFKFLPFQINSQVSLGHCAQEVRRKVAEAVAGPSSAGDATASTSKEKEVPMDVAPLATPSTSKGLTTDAPVETPSKRKAAVDARMRFQKGPTTASEMNDLTTEEDMDDASYDPSQAVEDAVQDQFRTPRKTSNVRFLIEGVGKKVNEIVGIHIYFAFCLCSCCRQGQRRGSEGSARSTARQEMTHQPHRRHQPRKRLGCRRLVPPTTIGTERTNMPTTSSA